MFKCTDPLNLPRGIAFWLVWDFEFQMSTGVYMRPCVLACVGERARGQAGKRTGMFILYVCSFFWCYFSLHNRISCVFFLYVRNYLIWLQWLRVSLFCVFFFVLCLLILVLVEFGSSSWGDKLYMQQCFGCRFMMCFTNAHFLCVLSVLICVCVCVCVWCRTDKPTQH